MWFGQDGSHVETQRTPESVLATGLPHPPVSGAVLLHSGTQSCLGCLAASHSLKPQGVVVVPVAKNTLSICISM